MHRAESPPAICLPTAGNGNKAVSGTTTDGSFHRLAEARSQNIRKAPLTMMLEGQQAPRQLIPVRPRCYHPEPHRSVVVNQSRRLLLCPEWILTQLTDLPCAAPAEYRIFLFTADTVDGNQHSQKVNQGRLQFSDGTGRSSLVRATTWRHNRLRRTEVGVDIPPDLPWTEPWTGEGTGITDGEDHTSSLALRLFLRKAPFTFCG